MKKRRKQNLNSGLFIAFSEPKIKKSLSYLKQIANFSKSLKFKHKKFFV